MGKNEDKSNEIVEGKSWFQIVAILICSFASTTTGMLISWSSPFIPKIVEDKINYDITEEQASFFAAINIIALIVLSPFSVPLIKIIGTKRGILFSVIPYSISLLMKAYVTDLWGLYLARFIIGFGDVFVFICMPVYVAEVSTPKVRGIMGNSFVCSVFFGQFLVNVLGTYFSVQETSYIALTGPVLVLTLFPFMPESPYFYITNGKDEEAKNSLKRLRRKSNIDEEFTIIQYAVKKQLTERGNWSDILKNSINRKTFLIVTFLRCSQIFGGLLTFGVYTKFIFQNSGTNLDPFVSAIVYSAANALFHSCAAFTSDKFGRRNSYIISTFLCALDLFTLGIFFLLHDYFPNVSLKKLTWFPLAGMLGYLLFCSFGLGTVPVLMLGELFPSSIKGKAIALVASFFGLAAFGINNFFYFFASYTGLCGPFFFFAVCNIFATTLSYFIVPETKGKTLEEIQESLKIGQ